MSVVSFKCPNCDGPMLFDAKTGQYTCEYCMSVFTQEELDALAEKEEKKKETAYTDEGTGAVIYTCPNCGAQIVTTETTAATMCYYCHNPVILSGRVSGDFLPDKIVPFAIDKKQATERFLAWARRKKFVPKNFFNAESIEKMTGVYYPYWVGDYEANVEFRGEGTRVNTVLTPKSQVVTTSYYDVERKGHLRFPGLIRGALSSADRKLDSNIHPFDLSQAKEFSMGYLSGYQAEKRDIETAAIEPEMTSDVTTYCDNLMRGQIAGYSALRGNTETDITAKNYSYVLLPSWILTYKGRDNKTYYYAMNAQTGAIAGDLPVDKPRLNGFCLMIGGIVAAVLLLGGYFVW